MHIHAMPMFRFIMISFINWFNYWQMRQLRRIRSRDLSAQTSNLFIKHFQYYYKCSVAGWSDIFLFQFDSILSFGLRTHSQNMYMTFLCIILKRVEQVAVYSSVIGNEFVTIWENGTLNQWVFLHFSVSFIEISIGDLPVNERVPLRQSW